MFNLVRSKSMKSKYFAARFLCIFLVLLSIHTKSTDAACAQTQFECENGSCISQFEVCNGVKNCPDGTDETALNCISQRQHCSKPYFQCSYGACVIGTAACNGVKECADGSDETVLRCGTEDDKREFDRTLQGNCQHDEIKCPSGICIDKFRYLCDGNDDCGDGTGFDESVTMCGHQECPGYSFKCASGSCISNQLVCDGKINCFDGSDEAPLLCNTTAATAPKLPSIPASQPAHLGCPLPDDDERPILTNGQGQVLTPPIFRQTVKFRCNRGYFLEGEETGYCANGRWSLPVVPKCVKYCDSKRDEYGNAKDLINGYSTNATCSVHGEIADCNQRYHPPGTVIKFICATGFQTLKTSLPEMKCMRGGYWNRYRERCDQECGQIATPVKQFSANGHSIGVAVVPWHVGLYSELNERGFTFLCGGSLLTPDIVITAAHCVFNEVASEPYSEEIFHVVAAKLYRGYTDETEYDNRRRVNQIVVASNYKGREDNFFNDLAMIILDVPYRLSAVIRPVCVHFYGYAEKETINNNVHGKFAGWNFKDRRELQFVPAQSQMNSVCKDKLRDIGLDKFCMYTLGQSLACHGDSGGGFTVERRTDAFSRDPLRHFLYGIISSAPNAGQCAESLTTLTNIQHFEGLITKAINHSVYTRS
ncbi:modular serine protease [Drosophila sulfurigaster albostrigata]|uniref:modular serine protease n=1 Tax=Drosophila sulfurigaster albostrigata TaxID=89887 RepID=UPI002D21B6E0|nr:modular serine protease [Drosophila sulfurigaster albostrigata]